MLLIEYLSFTIVSDAKIEKDWLMVILIRKESIKTELTYIIK